MTQIMVTQGLRVYILDVLGRYETPEMIKISILNIYFCYQQETLTLSAFPIISFLFTKTYDSYQHNQNMKKQNYLIFRQQGYFPATHLIMKISWDFLLDKLDGAVDFSLVASANQNVT